MEQISVISRLPTDEEITKEIEGLELTLKFLKNLLKLNDAGREQALIYMFGLTHFEKYVEKEARGLEVKDGYRENIGGYRQGAERDGRKHSQKKKIHRGSQKIKPPGENIGSGGPDC